MNEGTGDGRDTACYAARMPLYEFQCRACGAREEVFTRSVNAEVRSPACPKGGAASDHEMQRVVSRFARHLTVKDQVAEAEAKFGKEVDAAMGPEPDVGRYARRLGQLGGDLPPPENLQ